MRNSFFRSCHKISEKSGWLGVLFTLISFHPPDAGAQSTPSNPTDRPILSVYLPDYRVKNGDETPQLYGASHLVIFSGKPHEDGRVDFSRITSALLAFAENARRDKDLVVTLCVGGWGRGKEFATAVSSAESRSRFVEDLVNFCAEHHLDGVDIDWEFPKGDREHADFALFLAELSEKLHADDRILTAALGYTRPLTEECWRSLDRVNLMSYQPWSEQPYEPWLRESIERFLAAGLPPEKLLLGIGFYAKEKAGERRAVSWRQLVAENSAGLPDSEHGYWPVGTEACDLRLRLVKEYGLGGITIWDYGHDSPIPEKSLLRYLATGLGRYEVTE
ncbi:MAG: glycoside hydrolase family 18 protein [Verrucomicrobiae bacterium]|nr:glycoside hydrolase family 18 protein [Verrucomicrobiae bacterium]